MEQVLQKKLSHVLYKTQYGLKIIPVEKRRKNRQHFIVGYSFNSLYEAIYIKFMNELVEKMEYRTCKNCKGYLFMPKRSSQLYCKNCAPIIHKQKQRARFKAWFNNCEQAIKKNSQAIGKDKAQQLIEGKQHLSRAIRGDISAKEYKEWCRRYITIDESET